MLLQVWCWNQLSDSQQTLLVGAVGILTIMTMAVTERTAEIGLLRALGAQEKQVLMLFLGEAIMLSALGGVLGLIIGIGIAQGLHLVFPALLVHTPWLFAVLAELTAVAIGLAAGVAPPCARHDSTRWRHCMRSNQSSGIS